MRYLIGLGGNVGDVTRAFAVAADTLAARLAVVARSGVWRSAPLGPPQPSYLNAALLLEAELAPLRLLALLQMVEADAGRDRRREVPLGPRPLDLDLLLAPGLVVVGPALSLPHPRLAERRFALLPATEVAPACLHPRLHRTLEELASHLTAADQPCERLGPFPSVLD